MAKMIGGVLSKGSGRLGGYVLAVANGQQVIREYQPNVANPRTSLQRIQRAKMVLAGKLSQITGDDYIIGMAPSKRDRRSEFVRNIIKVAQVTETNGEYVANIQYDDLVFSKGAPASYLEAVITSWDQNGLTVLPSWDENIDAVMVLAVKYDSVTKRYVSISSDIVTTSGNAAILNMGGTIAGDKAIVYCIPLRKKTTSGSATTTGVNGDNNNYEADAQWGAADTYIHLASKFMGTKSYE